MIKNQERLNQYSKKVLERFQLMYPEFLKRIECIETEPGIFGIQLTIDTPNQEATEKLYLQTADDELTMGFDDFHCHFDSYSDARFEEEFDRAVKTMKKIISEDLVLCKGFKNSIYSQGQLRVRDELNELDKLRKEYLADNCDQFGIVSWTGKLDRIMEC